MADILMFHRVLPQERIVTPNAYWDRGTLITAAKLHQVLDALHGAGRKVLPLLELVEAMERGLDTTELVALTFDDGYSDNQVHALPILREYDCTASFFPVLGPVLTGELLPLDRYYYALDRSALTSAERFDHLQGSIKEDFITTTAERQEAILGSMAQPVFNQPSPDTTYMTPEQLHELHAAGHDIGFHTRWHRLLPLLSEAEQRHELEHGIQWLRSEFGIQQPLLAYPDGRSSPRVRSVARGLGYRCGLGVGLDRNALDLFDLPRHFVTMAWDVSQLGKA